MIIDRQEELVKFTYLHPVISELSRTQSISGFRNLKQGPDVSLSLANSYEIKSYPFLACIIFGFWYPIECHYFHTKLHFHTVFRKTRKVSGFLLRGSCHSVCISKNEPMAISQKHTGPETHFCSLVALMSTCNTFV